MPHYPLIRAFDPHGYVIWRDGRGVTAAQFLASAAALASRLPRKRHVVNVCQDRYSFLLGFTAALLAGQTSLMPNSRAAKTLRRLQRQYPDAYYFADHDDVPPQAPLVSCPPDLDESGSNTVVPDIPANQIAAIVFTSGSTGDPTPHIKTWESLVRGADALGWQFGMPKGLPRMVIGTVPPQHMYGLETTVMFPLQWGWVISARTPVFPKDLRLDLEDSPIPGWLMTTPLHLRACVGQHISPPNLEGVISATMPLLPVLARKAECQWNVPIYEIYGCTEGGMIATRRTATEDTWTLCGGLRIRQEEETAWVQGGHVGASVRLADRINVLTEQEFTLLGRANDLVKVGGRRTSLEALNAELTQIPGVRDGMFYVPDASEPGQERLGAVVVAPGRNAAFILDELRKRIDPVFLPRPLHLVEALPRNAVGKLARASLRAVVGSSCGAVRQ